MRYHLMMKVSTVLEMLGNKRETKRLLNMFSLDPDEIRQECEKLIEQGKVYLPTDGCDTKDPAGKCLGHEL